MQAPPSYLLCIPSLIRGPSGALNFLPFPDVYPVWSLLADSPLPFVPPPFPFEATWSHSQFILSSLLSPLSSELHSTLLLLPTIKLTLVHSPSLHSSPFFIVVFGIFHNSILHISDWVIGPSKRMAFLKVLVCAWACLAHHSHILILLSESLLSYISSSSLDTLFLSFMLQRSFVSFLLLHYSHRITVFKVDKTYALFGPPLWFSHLAREAHVRYDDLASWPSSRDLMLREWNDRFTLSELDLPYPVFTQPTTRTLPDFTLGCLLRGSCYLQSACFQLITGHAFHADYSDHFCPGAGDNTSCPHCCHQLMPTHIFVTCPDPCLICLRQCLIPGHFSYFFMMEFEAAQLCLFLHYSQALLRPLPPRPDPL